MEIKWFGHASFLITTATGIKIITDPYAPGGGILYAPITDQADIVLVSHDHADHNYVEGLPDKPHVIKGTRRHEVKGIVVEGFPTYHDGSQGAERGKNIIFTIVADDMRVCHLGDLGHVLSEKDVQKIGPIDVLLIPVGGFYTIGPEEAARVAAQLNPKLLIPMHVKNEKCTFPIEPVDSFLQGKLSVQRLNKSAFSFTRDELKGGLDIVVLQPAL